MKTYVPKVGDRSAEWWLVDAEGQNLGRLSSRIAAVLRGKHRADYTPHLDLGDHIVVVNAEKIEVTGDRMAQKRYFRHSGYPSGLREATLEEMLTKHPERVLRLAVRGMLPRTRLGRSQLAKLKVYAGPEHPHAAQAPRTMEIRTKQKQAEQAAAAEEGEE